MNKPVSIALAALLSVAPAPSARADAFTNASYEVREGDVRIVLTAQVASFEMEVSAVDPFAPGLILENGAFVAVSAGTTTSGVDGAPADVFEVFGALEGGQRIRVRGTGYLTGNPNPLEPDSYEGIELVFELIS